MGMIGRKVFVSGAIIGIALLCVLLLNSNGLAQNQPPFIGLIQSMEPEKTGLDHPSGLAYSSEANLFYVIEAPTVGSPASSTTVIRALSALGREVGTVLIRLAVENPVNLAIDEQNNRLLIYQASTHQVIEIRQDSTGVPDPNSLNIQLADFGLQNPQGMTYDPSHGNLIFLDSVGPRLVRVSMGVNGSFSNVPVESISIKWAAGMDLRGIALDPTSGNFHVVSILNKKLYELTPLGELVAARNLDGFNLSNPQGIIFAPSGDQTDNPSAFSLYLADCGSTPLTQIDQVHLGASDCLPSTGKLLEMTLVPPERSNFITNFQSTLVRTTNMAAYSPPSPDPAGLTYVNSRNTLLMSDSEVEETVSGITHFLGANLWEVRLDGSVIRTANISTVPPTVVPMTNEPTGVAWNASNGHYYFSDDNASRVYDLNPGLDGLVGTADDSWTSFSTSVYGNGDAEGVAYDNLHGRIFVVDGVNREVYQYSLSGSLVGQFDVQVYGVTDPEGIDFNPINGTLFVLSSASNRIIIETTITGSLLQTIDVSASASIVPAGLAYAPASDGSGAYHFYIVDRGIDNNTNPNIIDGKMYEMTAPASGVPGNTPPVVNAGPDQTVSIDNSAFLNGSASDDGLPNPPGVLTFQWSLLSGPGSVIFTNPNSLNTAASFSSQGTFALRLTAFDGELSSFDDVTITVTGSGGVTVLEVRVATSTDDSEESATGVIDITSSDLELVQEATIQKVGMRFNGITIPRNAQITYAYIQFQVDEVSTGESALTFWAEAQDNPGTFTTTAGDISSRITTSTSVDWIPPSWPVVGQAGLDQRTPNIGLIIQETVNRGGWSAGNSLVVIVGGTGRRTAEAYNGMPTAAPLLHIEYTLPGSNTPTATFTPTATNTPPSSPTPTYTPTQTPTSSPPAGSPTATYTPSPTHTPTSTPTSTATFTPTPTLTPSPTSSPTPVGLQTLEVRVSLGSDDAEESANGTVNLTHTNLSLVNEGSNQVVGIRFNNINIPNGATILYASIQFQAGAVNDQAATLIIRGQAIDNSPTFTKVKRSISSRTQTASSSTWMPPAWLLLNEAGINQITPDLSNIIQEIIALPGWAPGNSLTIIFTGSGTRTARSYNGLPAGAALLHIEYIVP